MSSIPKRSMTRRSRARARRRTRCSAPDRPLRSPQDLGVDHAAADRARPKWSPCRRCSRSVAERAAGVELEAGLDEGEVAGPQAHLQVTAGRSPAGRSSSCRSRCPTVMPSPTTSPSIWWKVCSWLASTVFVCGRQRPGTMARNGRFQSRCEGADLYGRRVRAQQQAHALVVAPERVVHLPRGRMVRRDVQRLEVVVVELHLRTVQDRR